MFKGKGDYQMKNVVSHNTSTLIKAPTLRYKNLVTCQNVCAISTFDINISF